MNIIFLHYSTDLMMGKMSVKNYWVELSYKYIFHNHVIEKTYFNTLTMTMIKFGGR
jgi:hypothetical protein